MHRIRSRFIGMGAVALTAVAVSGLTLGAGGAAAGKAKMHRYKMHARVVYLDSKTLVGDYTTPRVHRGSTINRVKSIDGLTATGKTTDYDRHGAIYSKFTVTLSPQPDGTLAYTGKGPITGGSGRYEGARGHWSGTCTQARGDPVIHCVYKVKVRY